LVLEPTLIWQERDIWLRSRPDAISKDCRILIDLKVTGTNARDCNRQFFNQNYDLQAAMMLRGADALHEDGRGRRTAYYVFVEDEPPHAAAVLQITEDTLTIARKKLIAAINIWRCCTTGNVWPGYTMEPILSERPGWEEAAWLKREEMDATICVGDV
jgi:PDDEXK-like domain of unknown function (DUF3799)